MKKYDDMNIVERAELLFRLFPDNMPHLIGVVKQICVNVREHEAYNRQQWTTGQLFSYDQWLVIAADIEGRINKYEKKLHKSARLFSHQLFDGLNALFMERCLHAQHEMIAHQYPRYAMAITLFFGYQKGKR